MSLRFSLLFTLAGTVLSVWGQAEILPDPTRPAGYETTVLVRQLPDEQVDWKLTAIRVSDTDRSAIVNGKTVRAGETIGTARIVEIDFDGIVIEHNSKRTRITLFSATNIKKQVNNSNQNSP